MFYSEVHGTTDDNHAPSTNPSEQTLLDCFKSLFTTIDADRPPYIGAAHRLRYQVYCVEKEFEDANAHPNELEKDEFDSHAVQGLLLHRATGTALGTARLVLPLSDTPERSFAVQRLLRRESRKMAASVPIGSTAEVSRFSISKHSLRRLFSTNGDAGQADCRSGPLMRLGLIQMLIRMSIANNITHWYCIIEPSLKRMLDAMAFSMEPVGPLVEFHGVRQPCFCSLSKVLTAMKHERPSFWDVLTDGGTLVVGS
jgi:N-acyl amino acid synthase of PEP-CTERM/exosortase system